MILLILVVLFFVALPTIGEIASMAINIGIAVLIVVFVIGPLLKIIFSKLFKGGG